MLVFLKVKDKTIILLWITKKTVLELETNSEPIINYYVTIHRKQ